MVEGAGEEDDSTDSGEAAFEVMMMCGDLPGAEHLAMTDTCCAKTVAGEAWAKGPMQRLWDQGIEFLVVREKEPFRFGPGERLYTAFALIFSSRHCWSSEHCARAGERGAAAGSLAFEQECLEGIGNDHVPG